MVLLWDIKCVLQQCNCSTSCCLLLGWCVRRVRAAYKAVQNPKDFERELPQCALGALLLSWVKQVGWGCGHQLAW